MQLLEATARAESHLVDCDASPGVAPELLRPRWWLWWNLLSLDAPAIAAAWALLFARSRRTAVNVDCIFLLAAAVWFIYVADRVLDGWTADASALRERHFFYAAHKKIFIGLSLAVAAFGLFFARAVLTIPEWHAGLELAAAVGLYFGCVHWGRRIFRMAAPKEVVVAVVFAAGTTLPLWSQPQIISLRGVLVWTLFAALCALNCIAIEFWESSRSSGPSFAVRWMGKRISFISLMLACAALAMFVLRDPSRSSGQGLIAIVVAALFLLILNQRRARFSAAAARVLADVALFAPACIVLLFRYAQNLQLHQQVVK